ncbi:MAG: ATP-binding protein, partial [Myxococcota bacterium]
IVFSVSRKADGHVEFSVQDTGEGIPPERLSSIFEPFTQADETTTRRFGGTGLGLTISAKLVSLMGGTLSVDSALEQGSRFWFSLTLPEAMPDARPTPPPITGPLPSLHILVAEDNPINQLVIEKMLTELGHSFVITADGQQALERFIPGRFDVGLFDVHMPRLDGRALTQQIRHREPPDQRLPIIALTASVLTEDVEACERAGMDTVLAKPISKDLLTRCLHAVMGGTGLAHASSA